MYNDAITTITVLMQLTITIIQAWMLTPRLSKRPQPASSATNNHKNATPVLMALGFGLIFFSMLHLALIQFSPLGAQPAVAADVARVGSCLVGLILGIWAVSS